VLGFLGFSMVAPVHQTLHASDQPVLLLDLMSRSFNRRIVFSRRRINRCSVVAICYSSSQLHRCFDFADVG